MILLNIFNNYDTLFDWVILPILIGLARIADQSIGTLRVVFVAKGKKNIAPILGFFEALIWILVVREILNNVSSPMCFIGYAAGFAAGNYIGLLLEEKLSLGTVIVRIITRNDESDLLDGLKEHNLGYTVVEAEGSHNKVKIIFCVINRTDMDKFDKVVKKHSPGSFYTVEDVKTVKKGGIFPSQKSRNPIKNLLK